MAQTRPDQPRHARFQRPSNSGVIGIGSVPKQLPIGAQHVRKSSVISTQVEPRRHPSRWQPLPRGRAFSARAEGVKPAHNMPGNVPRTPMVPIDQLRRALRSIRVEGRRGRWRSRITRSVATWNQRRCGVCRLICENQESITLASEIMQRPSNSLRAWGSVMRFGRSRQPIGCGFPSDRPVFFLAGTRRWHRKCLRERRIK